MSYFQNGSSSEQKLLQILSDSDHLYIIDPSTIHCYLTFDPFELGIHCKCYQLFFIKVSGLITQKNILLTFIWKFHLTFHFNELLCLKCPPTKKSKLNKYIGAERCFISHRLYFQAPGSLAEACGQFEQGDRILQCNGKDLRAANQHDAVNILKACLKSTQDNTRNYTSCRDSLQAINSFSILVPSVLEIIPFRK